MMNVTLEPSVYDISVTSIDNKVMNLSEYKDKVMLIVNVASQCGFTKQYKGLQQIYTQYASKGFVVLGFPCNQFGKQEPGDEGEIKKFCSLQYSVTFPMFKKIDVNGQNAHPLFTYLKKKQPGIFGTEDIKWNFTKFLVDKKGSVVERYASTTEPESLKKDIERLLL